MGGGGLSLYSGGQDTLYRIHGTNQPGWIGHAISSGCIRLTNEDGIDLYSGVKTGALVVVLGPKRGARRGTSASAQQTIRSAVSRRAAQPLRLLVLHGARPC